MFINIFDFLETFREMLKNPPRTDFREVLPLLKPRAALLKFPNNRMLGVYSTLTDRVFPIEEAKEGRTLVLLLRPIKKYLRGSTGSRALGAFKKEAGDELRDAKKEGHVAVRKLLLSREWKSLPLGRSG